MEITSAGRTNTTLLCALVSLTQTPLIHTQPNHSHPLLSRVRRCCLLHLDAPNPPGVFAGDRPASLCVLARTQTRPPPHPPLATLGASQAKAPPFDFGVLLLLCGFGAAVVYGVKYAIQRDGSLSKDVAQKMLGEEKKIGAGKPNKSALGLKKRSAKKT